MSNLKMPRAHLAAFSFGDSALYHQGKRHEPAPLPLSLLSYFKPSIYYAPLPRESAQRTIENSPAIYRWDWPEFDQVREADG